MSDLENIPEKHKMHGRCESCYWFVTDYPKDEGFCHAMPPTARGDFFEYAAWPRVKWGWYCGQWKNN